MRNTLNAKSFRRARVAAIKADIYRNEEPVFAAGRALRRSCVRCTFWAAYAAALTCGLDLRGWMMPHQPRVLPQ
jgi:hypothetical protein